MTNTSGWDAADQRPQNIVERMLFLFGRKFWLAFFAGVSSFFFVVVCVWIVARTAPETGRIIEQIVSAYLLAASAVVTAYSATNAVIERAHANGGTHGHTNGAVDVPRASGAVRTTEES
jgi:hypothetical protein